MVAIERGVRNLLLQRVDDVDPVAVGAFRHGNTLETRAMAMHGSMHLVSEKQTPWGKKTSHL
jgi:hypothetical protein